MDSKKRKYQTKTGLTLLLALILLTLTGLAQAASTWQIQTVDSTSNVGVNGSLALDNNDHPHISYMDNDNRDLKYATWDGSSWQIETVDRDGNVGVFSSLALDGSGNPHISYYDQTNGDLKYAAWDGSTWQFQVIDSAGDTGLTNSLALDSDGYPHISYLDATNGDLKYATWDGSSWQIETVDSQGQVGANTRLVLDTNDRPHISYTNLVVQNLGDLYLKYATWDGNSWQFQIIDANNEGSVGLYSSLALDSSDHPHISYYDDVNDDLKYAAWDGSSWQFQIVDGEGVVGGWTSLEFDEADHPHISYLDANNFDLKYAAWDGSSWHFQIVDSEGNVGIYSSLALDSSGNPHISYYDYGNGDLKYAVLSTDNTPPAITPNISGTLGNNGWYTSDVSVTWAVSDDESAISSTNGCDETTIATDTAGTTLSCEATSDGGSNSAAVTIQRDATPPTVSVTGVEDGAIYTLGVVPTPGCDTQDALSGVATAASLTISGSNANEVGSFTATCDGASDNAGNTASADVSYSVIYAFNGFFDPIDNLPTINAVKGGQTIPVKFSLNGDQGMAILADGYPVSQEVTCDSSALVNEVEETSTAGNSGLSYDPATDQYSYNWKTEKGWSGTCRQLIVRLDDSSEYSALFQFK